MTLHLATLPVSIKVMYSHQHIFLNITFYSTSANIMSLVTVVLKPILGVLAGVIGIYVAFIFPLTNSIKTLLYSSLHSAMTYLRRIIKPTEKVRHAQLDFATPGSRPAKRAWVNASATPACQILPTSSTSVQMRLSSPRASLFVSQPDSQPISKDDT